MGITALSMVMILTVAAGVFVEVVRGLKRGLVRTAVSLCAVVISALVAAPLAVWISDVPAESFADLLIRNFSSLAGLMLQFPSVEMLVVAAADVMISLLCFVSLFLLIRTILRAVLPLALSRVLKPLPDEAGDPMYESADAPFHRRHDRLLGGITGGVCGFLATLILLSPAVGGISAVRTVMDTTDRFKVKWDSFGMTADDAVSIKETVRDPVTRILEAAGGDLIFDMAANTRLNGRRVYLSDEVEACASAVGDLYTVVVALSRPDAAHPLDRELVSRLEADINGSEAAKMVAADFLNLAASAWLEGKTFMKLACPDGGTLFGPLLKGALAVCAESTPDCVARDLSTLLNVYIIAMENGLLSNPDYGALAEDLGDSGVLGQIYNELRRNPCTAHLADELSTLALRIMASAIDWSQFDSVRMEGLMDDLSDALNEVGDMNADRDGRVEAMKQYTLQYAEQYGVKIPASLAEMAAATMVDRLMGQGSVTAEELAQLLGANLAGKSNGEGGMES